MLKVQADVVALGGEVGACAQLARQHETSMRELGAAVEQQRLVLQQHARDIQRQRRRNNDDDEDEDEDKASSSAPAAGGAAALAKISASIISVAGSTSGSTKTSGGGGSGGRDFSDENPMLVLVQHRIEQLTALCRGLRHARGGSDARAIKSWLATVNSERLCSMTIHFSCKNKKQILTSYAAL